MASAKRIPKVSRISRDRTVAYARKQKSASDGEGDGGDDGGDDAPEDAAISSGGMAPVMAAGTTAPAAVAPGAATGTLVPGTTAPTAAAPGAAAGASAPAGSTSSPAITPPKAVEPWPDPKPMKPADPERARTATVAMPVQASIGAPPAMPPEAPAAPRPLAAAIEAIEDPTHMPGPREIPEGKPEDPASPPGFVPRGDSRSMRRRVDRYEFALIYRIQTFVISRVGAVGTRGQWRVVEYPTSASASHAYAKECSRFVSEGFSDYRG
jgi:hypothetical protein